MKKKREHDPELESLLHAFREVHPTSIESGRWRAAIADELKGTELPVATPAVRSNLRRLVLRTVIQVGVAASLGFVIGAYFVEKRASQGQTMLFSQLEPGWKPPPTTTDENREVVRINLDAGVGHE